jgi:hypothetical protein
MIFILLFGCKAAKIPQLLVLSIAVLILGTYAMLTEKEAVESVDAAVKAYDHGRGTWPTMSVFCNFLLCLSQKNELSP